VWAKLVSSPFAAFRRIFPEIEDANGRPIRRIWDLPTETGVLYQVVQGPVTVVGGPHQELYFPHIGGVHEYFLNCIQKTLRPQGFGHGCSTAPKKPPSPPGGPGDPPGGPGGPGLECYSFDGDSCCVCYICEGVAGDVWIELKNGTAIGPGHVNLGQNECTCAGVSCQSGWYCHWGSHAGGQSHSCP
jgi:ferredoxin